MASVDKRLLYTFVICVYISIREVSTLCKVCIWLFYSSVCMYFSRYAQSGIVIILIKLWNVLHSY